MMIIKLLGLALVNLVSYPLVVLITGGFFLFRRITFLDFIGKCGYVPLQNSHGKEYLWFHVSSAGEWNTGKIFARRLQEKTGLPLLITYFNGDLTEVLEKEEEFLSRDCRKLFLPVENTLSLGIIHLHYRVQAVIILETEIWPSLILASHWLGKKVFLVNAVLFSQETRNFLIFKHFFSPILNCFDHIYCISEKARSNFLKLEVSERKITVMPNFKYDVLQRVENLGIKGKNTTNSEKKSHHSIKNKRFFDLENYFSEQRDKKRRIIVLASFHKKEILKIWTEIAELFSDQRYCIVIAPREIRPPMIYFLEKLFQNRGYPYIKRSEVSEKKDSRGHLPSNLILDSFGELSSLYSLVDLVIMGGTYIPIGGHNFLEAIFFDKMVFLGKYVHHYEDFVDSFKDHVKKTTITNIAQEIEDFFLHKRYSGIGGGYVKIIQFSGSSMKTADLIYEKIKNSSLS